MQVASLVVNVATARLINDIRDTSSFLLMYKCYSIN